MYRDSGNAGTRAEDLQIITGELKEGDFANAPHQQEYVPGGNGAPAVSAKTKSDATWPVMAPQAFRGLAGEFVQMVDPHTESDRAALLV